MKSVVHSLLFGPILAILLVNLPAWGEQIRPSFQTYLTTEAGNNQPASTAKTHFECSDTIFSVVEVTAPDRQISSKHLLIVKWFNPDGKLEQRTRFEFDSYGKGTRVWAWLRLSGSTGASVGRMFDPAFGMSEFIGDWRAEVYIDNDKVATHKFDVLC